MCTLKLRCFNLRRKTYIGNPIEHFNFVFNDIALFQTSTRKSFNPKPIDLTNHRKTHESNTQHTDTNFFKITSICPVRACSVVRQPLISCRRALHNRPRHPLSYNTLSRIYYTYKCAHTSDYVDVGPFRFLIVEKTDSGSPKRAYPVGGPD